MTSICQTINSYIIDLEDKFSVIPLIITTFLRYNMLEALPGIEKIDKYEFMKINLNNETDKLFLARKVIF